MIEKDSEFHSLGLVLGYRYTGSPVVLDEDGVPAAEHDPVHYVPDARPGSRLPHRWIADDRSLYDDLSADLTLLKLDSEADPGALVEAARRRNAPLQVLDLSNLAEVVEQYGAALVLVRPDQHVSWRSFSSPDEREAERIFDTVTGITGTLSKRPMAAAGGASTDRHG